MAYVFENQILGTTKATVTGTSAEEGVTVTHNLQGINARQSNADSIMAGVNELYGIVGWATTDLTRTVKQDVHDNE